MAAALGLIESAPISRRHIRAGADQVAYPLADRRSRRRWSSRRHRRRAARRCWCRRLATASPQPAGVVGPDSVVIVGHAGQGARHWAWARCERAQAASWWLSGNCAGRRVASWVSGIAQVASCSLRCQMRCRCGRRAGFGALSSAMRMAQTVVRWSRARSCRQRKGLCRGQKIEKDHSDVDTGPRWARLSRSGIVPPLDRSPRACQEMHGTVVWGTHCASTREGHSARGRAAVAGSRWTRGRPRLEGRRKGHGTVPDSAHRWRHQHRASSADRRWLSPGLRQLPPQRRHRNPVSTGNAVGDCGLKRRDDRQTPMREPDNQHDQGVEEPHAPGEGAWAARLGHHSTVWAGLGPRFHRLELRVAPPVQWTVRHVPAGVGGRRRRGGAGPIPRPDRANRWSHGPRIDGASGHLVHGCGVRGVCPGRIWTLSSASRSRCAATFCGAACPATLWPTLPEVDGFVWHGFLPEVQPGQRYNRQQFTANRWSLRGRERPPLNPFVDLVNLRSRPTWAEIWPGWRRPGWPRLARRNGGCGPDRWAWSLVIACTPAVSLKGRPRTTD